MWYLDTYPAYNIYFTMDGMYWDEFAKLIYRNSSPESFIKIYSPSKLLGDICTICDYHLPRRAGIIYTGNSHDDMDRDSIVCNASWFNGSIPMKGWAGSITEGENNEQIINRPARGAVQTIKLLARAGVILPTVEIKMLLDAKWFIC